MPADQGEYINKTNIIIFIHFLTVYAFGWISKWVYQTYPFFDGTPTIFIIISTLAAGMSVFSAIFLGLIISLNATIEPLTDTAQGRNAVFDGEEFRYDPNSIPDDFSIPDEVLQNLGYKNVQRNTQDSSGDDP